jgi:glycosyltransferase involved in cell wall biosynthesis
LAVRVLHTIGEMDPGGVENWLMQLLRNIEREHLQFDFCTFGPQPGRYVAEIENRGGKVLRCQRENSLWSLSRRFRRILREGKYDVVHSHVHLFSGVLLRWANAEGVPVRIAHSHTSRDDKPHTLLRQYYRRTMKSWIHRHATFGLAVSRLAAEELFGENWQADVRFRVLHCGIDLQPFQDPVVSDEVRIQLGIPTNVPVVGHVGRFVLAKNHHFLLEVFSEILKKQPETHFLLIGDGVLLPEIRAQADVMGLSAKIHFAGVRTDVPRLMRGAMDVLVFPSSWEGLPITLIEAQASGLRCIVSEEVTDEASVLADQFTRLSLFRSPQEWAAETVNALQRGKIQPGQALKAISQSDFCIQRSSSTLLSLYAAEGSGWA